MGPGFEVIERLSPNEYKMERSDSPVDAHLQRGGDGPSAAAFLGRGISSVLSDANCFGVLLKKSHMSGKLHNRK